MNFFFMHKFNKNCCHRKIKKTLQPILPNQSWSDLPVHLWTSKSLTPHPLSSEACSFMSLSPESFTPMSISPEPQSFRLPYSNHKSSSYSNSNDQDEDFFVKKNTLQLPAFASTPTRTP